MAIKKTVAQLNMLVKTRYFITKNNCYRRCRDGFLMAKNSNLLGSILVATGQVSLEKLKSYSHMSVESLNKISIIK